MNSLKSDTSNLSATAHDFLISITLAKKNQIQCFNVNISRTVPSFSN